MEKKDNVNHPSHYTKFKVEVIETIQDWIQYIANPKVAYLVGTALKYIPRSYLKHSSPIEDLKKAVFYLNEAIRVLEEESEEKENFENAQIKSEEIN